MSETTTPWAPTNKVHAQFETLLQGMADRHAFTDLNATGFDAFVSAPGLAAILFVEDPARHPEVWDVAVVLPEVLASLRAPVRGGFARPDAAAQWHLRYGFTRWPAVVFLRAGEYIGCIEGMRDWTDYVERVGAMLARPVSRAPSVGIPVRAESPRSSSTCG